MIDEQRIYEFGGLVAAGYGLYQARKIHDTELEKSKQRHLESIELAKKQHENDMKTVKQTYLLELFNSLEQHFQQLNADLIASSRESERDMFDQRNQSFQTIILASSVMFSALASIIVDGNLPINSGQFLLVAYSLTCSLSFSFLFLSIVFCIELVIRTSSFMYKRGRSHTKNLQKAIHDTKGMMRELRGEGRGLSISAENVAAANSTGVGNSDLLSEAAKVGSMRRAISRMAPNEIEIEFDRHEHEIRGYLKKREVLNDSAAVTSYVDEVTGIKRPFKHFWEESCETWWSMAILLFYGGSVNMLLALMIYMWAQFFIFYSSIVAAVIGVTLLGLILVVGIGTVIVMRHVDRETDKRENAFNFAALNNQNNDISGSSNAGNGLDAAENGWSRIPFLRRNRSTNSLADEMQSPHNTTRPESVAPQTRNTESTQSGSTPSDGRTQGNGSMQTPTIHQSLGSTGRENTGRNGTSSDSDRGNARHASSARATPKVVENLPARLETVREDMEMGSFSDCSVNSVLTIPPNLNAYTATDHIFQEEPSPRRRFLSGFGSGHKSKEKKGRNGESPSLYRSSLCANSTSASVHESDRNGCDNVSGSAEGVKSPGQDSMFSSASTPDHATRVFHFPRSFVSRDKKSHSSPSPSPATGGAGAGGGGGAGKRSARVERASPGLESIESGSNLSNMSGGISF